MSFPFNPRRSCLLAAFLFLSFTATLSAQDSLRVLFAGNSYTYFNSVPQLFAEMVEHQNPGQKVKAKFLGGGGATLEKHWEVGWVLDAIKTGTWDYVVLQEQSSFGSEDISDPEAPNNFYKFAEMFDKEIKANGGQTVFYMTWAKKDLPEQQVYLTEAYTHIADSLDSILAPVGLVWSELQGKDGIELYAEDGAHPNIMGSYVAAMTIATALFGPSSSAMPGELVGYEILRGGALSEEKKQLSSLSDEEVMLIQGVVRAVTEGALEEVGQ